MINKERAWIAWAAAAASFVTIFFVRSYIETEINIKTYTQGYSDGEPADVSTTFGMASMCIAFMVAFAIGRVVYFGEINGGYLRKERIDFSYWVLGFFIISIYGAISQIFIDIGVAGSILEIAFVAVTFFLLKKLRDSHNR